MRQLLIHNQLQRLGCRSGGAPAAVAPVGPSSGAWGGLCMHGHGPARVLVRASFSLLREFCVSVRSRSHTLVRRRTCDVDRCPNWDMGLSTSSSTLVKHPMSDV